MLSPRGELFNQITAKKMAKASQIILICGRYEGFDQRISNFVDLELSLGQYVLMGGEVAAMALIESVTRLIPGVLGKKDSLKEETYSSKDLKYREYPQYTRPAVFKGLKAPKVLLSGDHEKIKIWRNKKHTVKT